MARPSTAAWLGGWPLALLLIPTPLHADPAPAVTGREAVERFAANVRSFPHYTCRYAVTLAEAYTFDDALAGKWVNAVSIDCVLRVDGEYEVWTGKKPAPAGPLGRGQWGATVSVLRRL